jgi:hypothetical protein
VIVTVEDHEIATGREARRVGPDHDERWVDLASRIGARDSQERNLPALERLARVAVREAPVLQHVEESHAGR